MTDEVVQTFYLHVKETLTDYEPVGMPSLRVQVIRTPEGLFQQTTLSDVRVGRSDWLVVQPHGRGWSIWDANNDGKTVWRRPHNNAMPEAITCKHEQLKLHTNEI